MRARIDISEIEVRDEDPRQVPARARERGVGPAARARPTSRASCAPTPTRWASTASSSSRSTSCATSASATSSCSRSPRPGASAGAARRAAAIPRGWLVVVVAVAGLIVALLLPRARPADPNTASTPAGRLDRRTATGSAAPAAQGAARRRPPGPSASRSARLADRRHRPGLRLPEGGGQAHAGPRRRSSPGAPARARAGRRASACTLGNGEARLRRQRQVALACRRSTTGIGYEITPPARVQSLPRASWPSCRPHERARRHRRHRHRGPHRAA